jgi:SAM-dependent methyltransferase
MQRPGGPVLRSACGATIPLGVDRWRADVDDLERHLLGTLADPVLDIGCGPGRIVAAMAAAGRVALGVDVSHAAVAETRRRGAAALGRSVFSPLPGERRWTSVVLFDGNIGIGGDPIALLSRVAELLAPGGVVLAEVEPPGTVSGPLDVRVQHGPSVGPWFEWARVSADCIEDLLVAAGIEPRGVEQHGRRWFARGTAR